MRWKLGLPKRLAVHSCIRLSTIYRVRSLVKGEFAGGERDRPARLASGAGGAIFYELRDREVGGKQYRVEEGDSILVDRMRADEGDKVDLEPLMFADGDKSVLDGERQGEDPGGRHRLTSSGKKIHGLKFKPKRGYKRRYGAPRST